MLTSAPVSAVLPVVDLARAKRFYEETLGLKVKDEQSSPGHILFECGQGTTLLIYQRGASKADHTAAGCWVEDLAAQMVDLRRRGVVFEEYDYPGLKTINGVASAGKVRSAWFKDPEGNILGLNQVS